MSVESKCCVCFSFTIGQARSHLCHVGSPCSSHPVSSTDFADKRGSLEQARTSLCHVGGVKVVCPFSVTLEQGRSHRSVRTCSRLRGNKTWALSPRFTPRCSTRRIDGEKNSLAINPVALPTIWGKSGVSMMDPTPYPPYKIGYNFKLQSCGPNFSWGVIKFVRLD